MNIYRVSAILSFQTQSWWLLADDEEEAKGIMNNLLGTEAVKHIKLLVERIPFRKGMLCSETNNREVWLKAFKPEEWKKMVEESDAEEAAGTDTGENRSA